MAFDLATADGALEPVKLPRGIGGAPPRELAARDFNKAMKVLAQRMAEGDESAVDPLIRLCVPDITDVELDDLSEREKALIIGYCGRRLAEVVEFLKNVARAEAVASISPRSARTTKMTTPSPATRRSSTRTGGRSTPSRSTAPSTPSTV